MPCIKIPSKISIVGVDNDPPFYKLCRPQLTSVEPYHAKVGYHAAEILDQQMRGIACGKKVYTIKQHSLSVRVSSDWLAIEDSQVRKALRVIQKMLVRVSKSSKSHNKLACHAAHYKDASGFTYNVVFIK